MMNTVDGEQEIRSDTRPTMPIAVRATVGSLLLTQPRAAFAHRLGVEAPPLVCRQLARRADISALRSNEVRPGAGDVWVVSGEAVEALLLDGSCTPELSHVVVETSWPLSQRRECALVVARLQEIGPRVAVAFAPEEEEEVFLYMSSLGLAWIPNLDLSEESGAIAAGRLATRWAYDPRARSVLEPFASMLYRERVAQRSADPYVVYDVENEGWRGGGTLNMSAARQLAWFLRWPDLEAWASVWDLAVARCAAKVETDPDGVRYGSAAIGADGERRRRLSPIAALVVGATMLGLLPGLPFLGVERVEAQKGPCVLPGGGGGGSVGGVVGDQGQSDPGQDNCCPDLGCCECNNGDSSASSDGDASGEGDGDGSGPGVSGDT